MFFMCYNSSSRKHITYVSIPAIYNWEDSDLSEHNEEIYDETLDDLIRYGDLRVNPMTLQLENSETVEVSDDKQYPDAPYSVKNSGQESVSVSNGGLSYTSKDLALPGKNGFDLVITRQYDSNDCGKEKLKVNQLVGGTIWFYTVQLEDDSANSRSVVNCDIGPFMTETKCRSHAQKTVKAFRDQYRETDPSLKPVAYLRHVVTNRHISTEPNNFFSDQYGLGHGWKFLFPCIETSTSINRELVVHDYLDKDGQPVTRTRIKKENHDLDRKSVV